MNISLTDSSRTKMFFLLIMITLIISVPCIAAHNEPKSSSVSHHAMPVVFNVRDYGAMGNGKHNDAPAIMKAIQAATKHKEPTVVFLPNGTYRLASAFTDRMKITRIKTTGAQYVTRKGHIMLANVDHLTLRGEKGTVLLGSPPRVSDIRLLNASNVTVENLVIEHDPLPYSQGTVISVDGKHNTVKVKIDKGFPPPTDKIIQEAKLHRIYMFNDKGNRKLTARNMKSPSAEKVGDHLYKLNVLPKGRAGKDISTGDHLVLVGRNSGGSAIGMDFTRNCTFKNIKTYSSYGVGYKVLSSSNIAILHCKIEPKPNTNHLLSTDADGIYSPSTHIGPCIIGCFFSHMGDDGVNIHGRAMAIFGQTNPNTIIVNYNNDIIYPGHRVAIANSLTGEIRERAKIKQAALLNSYRGSHKRFLRLTLNHPVHAKTVKSSLPVNLMRTSPSNWWGKIKTSDYPDMLIDLDAIGNGFVIRNNHFYYNYTRGILVRATTGLIENNTIEGMEGPGIWMGILLPRGSAEVAIPRGIAIFNNRFINVHRSNIYLQGISAAPRNKGISGIVPRGMLMMGNTFNLPSNPRPYGLGVENNAIYLSNASYVVVTNNYINASSVPAKRRAAAVILHNCKKIQIQGNTYKGYKSTLKIKRVK